MSNEVKVGVAFVGAGLVAHMHARAVAACDGAELIGAYDPIPSHAEAITQQYGGQAFQTLDQLLADPAIHAVHVLTPPAAHVETALAALRAGKHALIEKPVADTVGELEQLKQTAHEQGRVCMPAHNYIYVPSLRRAKRLIEI